MEDRYEIRGKIGAGGLGTVYRGFDLKMRREVAIKRILTNPDDPSVQEEATKQLAAEAGALASLQHPHIVTVYDVGHDEDGPYVVMELIEGRTLDDIIETDPLMWKDFRELAMQTQEALIAAQELNMIHSDLKPPNLMLTWLPSGKFQVKIVDFGLAMLAQNQNAEELATIETVFGSIFFMPPEQFEREVLDARSDLYSMGCVYYQCLTGKYPFMGYDGEEVMNAHLDHNVTPIQDIRADVPIWMCDWVMWQINRNREDRPQSAREALAVFLKNMRQNNPEMSTGRPPSAGPKLILPGQAAADPDAPEPIVGKPLLPPDVTTSVEMMAYDDDPEPEPEPEPARQTTVQVAKAQPQPTGALISPTRQLGSATPTVAAGEEETQDGATPTVAPIAKPPRQPMSGAAKAVIAVVLGVLVIIFGMALLSRSKQNEANARLNELLEMAAESEEVLMNSADLDMLLQSASYAGTVEGREQYFETLKKAKSSEGADFDLAILKFATEGELVKEVRRTLIGEVLRDRANPAMVTQLLDYAKDTEHVEAAVAAYRAVYQHGNDGLAREYLDVILLNKNGEVLREAETNLAMIIDKSATRQSLSGKVGAAYSRAQHTASRHALIRLLGLCSTDGALDEIQKALVGDDPHAVTSAVKALGNWKDVRATDVLLDFLSKQSDPKIRMGAMQALLTVASQDFSIEDEAKAKALWGKIQKEVTTKSEKMKFINDAVILEVGAWRSSLVQPYAQDADDQVKDYAKKGLAKIPELDALRKKGQGGGDEE